MLPGRGDFPELQCSVVNVMHGRVKGEGVHPHQHEVVDALLLRRVPAFVDIFSENKSVQHLRLRSKFSCLILHFVKQFTMKIELIDTLYPS